MSKYKPHQGDQEKARRVQQGNAPAGYLSLHNDADHIALWWYIEPSFRAPHRFTGRGRVRL